MGYFKDRWYLQFKVENTNNLNLNFYEFMDYGELQHLHYVS